ncbi:MAG: dual specificity protein phosphatase family protein [Caldilineaceae bacterium]|nr:dual specificity protein phosphatase family protein [Caldilineaceae bacterium]
MSNFSRITDLLYLSSLIRKEHLADLHTQKIRLLINMTHEQAPPEVRRPPVRVLHLPTFDTPFLPIRISILRRGVEAALAAFESQERVLVYCRYGIHRSVAMASCILIAQGMGAEEAMAFIKQQRPVADPTIWYIRRRIVRFEKAWRGSI